MTLLSTVLTLAAAAQGPEPTQASSDLIRHSRYIFRGRVDRLNASNLKLVAPDSRTAVVTVRSVLDAPSTLNDFTGASITVRLLESSHFSPQDEAIFFTTSWLYGESLGVIEVGHLAATVSDGEIGKQIAADRQRARDEQLTSRIARSALVLSGRVTATRIYDSQKRLPITEHNPDWQTATIEIDSIVKGQWKARQIDILFPASTDEMWLNSHKFKVGESGIWILQNNQEEKGFPVLRVPGWTALDPLDFQPLTVLPKIREMAKASQ